MKTYELAPQFTNQKSFYRKAFIKEHQGLHKLYSYDTHVMTLNDSELVYLTDREEHYSNTTLKHMKEFLQQNAYPKVTKQQLIKGSRYLQRHDVIRSFQDVKEFKEN